MEQWPDDCLKQRLPNHRDRIYGDGDGCHGWLYGYGQKKGYHQYAPHGNGSQQNHLCRAKHHLDCYHNRDTIFVEYGRHDPNHQRQPLLHHYLYGDGDGGQRLYSDGERDGDGERTPHCYGHGGAFGVLSGVEQYAYRYRRNLLHLEHGGHRCNHHRDAVRAYHIYGDGDQL